MDTLPQEIQEKIFSYLPLIVQFQLYSGINYDQEYLAVLPDIMSMVHFKSPRLRVDQFYKEDTGFESFKFTNNLSFSTVRELNRNVKRLKLPTHKVPIELRVPISEFDRFYDNANVMGGQFDLILETKGIYDKAYHLGQLPSSITGLSLEMNARNVRDESVRLDYSSSISIRPSDISPYVSRLHLYESSQFPFGSLPRLKELTIERVNSPIYDELSKCRLTMLSLESLEIPFDISSEISTTLKTLVMRSVVLSRVFEGNQCLLKKLVNLQNLTVDFVRVTNQINLVELPDLLTLDIGIVSELTSKFQFPKTLRKLRILCENFWVNPTENFPQELETFELSCMDTNLELQELSIKQLIWNNNRVIAPTPSLQSLIVRRFNYLDNYNNLKCLTISRDGQTIGIVKTPPSLVFLKVSNCYFTELILNPGLKDLQLEESYYENSLDAIFNKGNKLKLPKSLIFFEVTLFTFDSMVNLVVDQFPPNLIGMNLSNIVVKSLSDLKSLKYLEFNPFLFHFELNQFDFNRLQYLRLETHHLPYDLMAKFPRSLENLICYNISDIVLHPDTQSPEVFDLKDLELKHFRVPKYLGADTIILPAGLQILDCTELRRKCNNFDFSHVRDCEIIIREGIIEELPHTLKVIFSNTTTAN